MQSTKYKLGLLALAVSQALLSACGGGSDEAAPPKAAISRVIVAGDSLADVGAFGLKFTVQNSASASGFPVYPQIVAQAYGIASQCNFYQSDGATFTQNPAAGCTNYALGGGRIRPGAAQGGTASPLGVPTQLATAATVAGGAWAGTDLLLIEGGGNDAADLVTAYLGAASGGAGVANYQAFLAQQLDAATIGGALTQANGAAIAAGLYMQKLAGTYYDAIKASALDKGATHVAVLNMPDITLTPRFQAVLVGVAQASGGGTNGATAAATLQAAIRQWIGAFNGELKTRIGGDSRVALVDFYADLNEEVSNPAAFGLTNAATPACPAVGVDGSGLPVYDFPSCTSAALDAAPPAGWWNTYAFSDSFHPTPYGHRLLAASISRALARAGWL